MTIKYFLMRCIDLKIYHINWLFHKRKLLITPIAETIQCVMAAKLIIIIVVIIIIIEIVIIFI